MKHVGLSVARNQIEGSGDAHRLFVKVDGKHLLPDIVEALDGLLLEREQQILRDIFVLKNLFPDVEDGVDGKAATAGRRVDHGLVRLRVEHLHTHVDDIARGEILSLFPLAALAHQVFKGVVHHVEIGVEELDVLQARHTDGKVGACERNGAVV